jgi:iron only hydrogenase large subunit-like protein
MANYFHSVTLDTDKCQGCTNCIKRCPVEAIRVYQGMARIIEERCIDCGECIRCCPNHAKIAITDTLERLSDFEYRIVLPAPSFFGQFGPKVDIEKILEAFLYIGFDAVYEVALAAEVVGYMVAEYLATSTFKKPLISSACPGVIRLLQMKFPDLLEHVAPIMSPMEVAARLAKSDAMRTTGLPYEKIGAFFISPCPAKVTEMRQPLNIRKSAVDGVIGASFIYKDLVKYMCEARGNRKDLNRATSKGIAWGYLTGESRAIGSPSTLSTGGIQNAISVLEEVERGGLQDLDFIEVQACSGGCVAGPLNIQNLFAARINIKNIVNKAKTKEAYYNENQLKQFCTTGDFWATEAILPRPIMSLDGDVSEALKKMERLDELTAELPGLDCGACGSPNCRALAEDIIRGNAFTTDCIVKLRERVKVLAEEILDLALRQRVKVLAEEILDLARKLPHAMADNKSPKEKKDDH